MDHDHQRQAPRFWGSRYSMGLLVIGAVAAYFLLTEHLAHVISALPFLLLLACPLMHIFMHHGHGGHGHHHDAPDSDKQVERGGPS
ncbi:DUF2933 domain-containing protein [Chitinibacter sp. GC72]|uniref:DUF2933 domain-containing protein n=1 Tax=Chitinibacter sp. GC72 TaxID=1526917 RepID=UPI0012FA5B7A